jgi:DNA-binding response OmpR family regulator
LVRALRAGAALSILLVQHDSDEASALAGVLEHAGLRVTVALEPDARELLDATAFDIVAIGEHLPHGDGARLCRRLRAGGYLGAIVVLGVVASDVPALLDAGADDFVLAPTQSSELIARAQMALRRAVGRARWRWWPVEVDPAHRTARLRGQPLPLTAREYALLSYLVEARGEVVSRADLLSRVWARDEEPGSNLVEVHLSRLRDKLGADADVIETVRRAGYRLRQA